MAEKYLLSITVAYLLPDDYEESRLQEIKATTIQAVKHFCGGDYYHVPEEKIAFSCPRELSIESPTRPVMISIRFHGGPPAAPIHEVRRNVGLGLESSLAFKRRNVVIDVPG